jgi:inorganic pyrophosphatase/exopolyphosphatase|tara:strand:- start:356 stop:523 length:168 start_codon:yes stop_codon:yes gene_type:complete
MILYSEDMLNKVYKIYRMHQAKHNLGFMVLEDFRLLFEEQQQAILDQIEAEADAL